MSALHLSTSTPCLVLLVLALTALDPATGLAQVADEVAPGPLVTIPSQPTEDDVIELRIETISGGCVPYPTGIKIDPEARTVEMRGVENIFCGGCPAVITSYTAEASIGRLPAGEWQLSYVVRQGCTLDEIVIETTNIEVLPSLPCPGGSEPGATLFVPYFEVDLEESGGRDTIVTVTNASFEPVLANIVLWTDRGLPTLSFPVHLGADGAQPISLYSVLSGGRLPQTEPQDGEAPPGCDGGALAPPPLTSGDLEILAAQHTGRPHPDDDLCYGSGAEGPLTAVGFITIDVVRNCSETIRYPGDDGYFALDGEARATLDNVLTGDVLWIDSPNDAAQGVDAVAILADPDLPSAGSPTTFYHRFAGTFGADRRRPLATSYRTRFLTGGASGMATELLTWTEGARDSAGPRECTDTPPPPSVETRLEVTVRDQPGKEVGALSFRLNELARRIPVGQEPLDVTTSFGQLDLGTVGECLLCAFPGPPERLQTWIVPRLTAAGRFSVTVDATPLDARCRR